MLVQWRFHEGRWQVDRSLLDPWIIGSFNMIYMILFIRIRTLSTPLPWKERPIQIRHLLSRNIYNCHCVGIRSIHEISLCNRGMHEMCANYNFKLYLIEFRTFSSPSLFDWDVVKTFKKQITRNMFFEF